MSMLSTPDDKSHTRYRRDYLPPTPQRSISLLESKDSENSGASFHTSSFHGTLPSDVDDNTKRRNYLPPTRHSLRLLDDARSLPLHRGSSASDTDYSNYKSWETSHVLPPLPRNVSSYNRRRDSNVLRVPYGRQRSSEVIDSLYASQEMTSNRRLHSKILEAVSEDVKDRPKHSSSLPSIARGKINILRTHIGTTEPEIVKKSSSVCDSGEKQNNSNLKNNPKEISMFSDDSILISKKEVTSNDTINNARVEKEPIHYHHKNNPSKADYLGDREKRSHSKIPSLLRYRSSSLNRELEKHKLKSTATEDLHTLHNETCNSSQLPPEQSILSKFFRSGSEERSNGTLSENFSSENKDDNSTNKKSRRISRFLRPDFFDTPREESSYVKEKEAQKAAEADQKKAKRLARRALLMEKNKVAQADAEVQRNKEKNSVTTKDKDGETVGKNNEVKIGEDKENNSKILEFKSSPEKQRSSTGNKNRFLHSLEKKLEKFRSLGDNTLSSGKGRVEKAIRSLQEYSITPQGSDLTSESNLLKRAVSVDDVCAKSKMSFTNGNTASSSKLGCKVSSILGLFRKMEDFPSHPTVLIPRLRRTQSVYAGSHSDSLLLAQTQENMNVTSTKAAVQLSQNTAKYEDVDPFQLNNTASADIASEGEGITRNIEILSNNAHYSSEENAAVSIKKESVCNAAISESLVPHLQDTDLKITSSDTKVLKKIRSKCNIIKKEGANRDQLKQTSSAAKDIPENATRKCRPKLSITTDKVIKHGTNHENSKVLSKQNDGNNFDKEDQEKNVSKLGDKLNLCNQHTKDKAALIKCVAKGNAKQGHRCDDVTSSNLVPNGVIDNNSCIEPNEINVVAKASSCKIEQVQDKTIMIPNGAPSIHKEQTCKVGSPHTISHVEMHSEDGKSSYNCLPSSQSMNQEEIKIVSVDALDCYSSPPDNTSMLALTDEMETCDSWSVCSDIEGEDLPAPPSLDDEGKESVEDRIRRKSFYSRFNDVKKKGHRKPTLRDTNSRPAVCLPSGKTHRSKSLLTSENLVDRLSLYNPKSPIPSRSSYSCLDNNLNHLDNKMIGSKLHNGCSDSLDLEENSKTLGEECICKKNLSESSQYTSGHVNKSPSKTVSSYNTGDIVPCSNIAVRQRNSNDQLLRSADFVPEVTRNSSLHKSRLPTASWEHRATTLGTTQPPSSSSCSTRAFDRESSHLSEKYNRFNTEPPPSS